jgi:3-oxoacyl-[acyl-carrier protein] reductase
MLHDASSAPSPLFPPQVVNYDWLTDRDRTDDLFHGKAIVIQADAADAEAVTGAVEKAVAIFGRVDVLVNNAGTAIPKPFEKTTLEDMDRVINIYVRDEFATTQQGLKHMKGGGHIIMVCSAVGGRAVASGLVPYAATKGAVKMFTHALSREVGAGASRSTRSSRVRSTQI